MRKGGWKKSILGVDLGELVKIKVWRSKSTGTNFRRIVALNKYEPTAQVLVPASI